MFPIYAPGCFTIGRADLFWRLVTLQEFKSNMPGASDFKLQGSDDGSCLDTVSLLYYLGLTIEHRGSDIVPPGEGTWNSQSINREKVGGRICGFLFVFIIIATGTRHRFHQKTLQA